jgi:hypothetical protein
MSDGVKILEEYGIPIQISQKLGIDRISGESVDEALVMLREMVGSGLSSELLSQFEESWLSESVGF